MKNSIFCRVLILISFSCLVSFNLIAQEVMSYGEQDSMPKENNLLVEAQVLKGSKPFEGVIIQVFKGNEVSQEVRTNDQGYFKLVLNFDSLYKIAFSSKNYVTKFVEVDTREMPEEDRNFGYDMGLFKIGMVEINNSVDQSVYKKPLARFRYNEVAQIFVVDKVYKKEVKKRFEEKDQKPEVIKF